MPANVVPWVGGAMATTFPTLTSCVFGTYSDWKPPSEWPTRSTFAAPVQSRTCAT